MNWVYRSSGGTAGKRADVTLVELTNTVVTIRAGGNFASARSAMLEQDLPIRRVGDAVQMTVPRLAEGDVIVLDR
jgi:hypothetical protein